MTHDSPPPNSPQVTPQEREEFLREQGWRPEMDAGARTELETYWTDADIQMARRLGLS